jgi:hypothetical protein
MPKVPSTGDIELTFAARQAGGRALWFYPTIGAAIAAGLRGCFSPARRAGSSARSTCVSLILSISCRQCSPNAPFARLEMLTAERA